MAERDSQVERIGFLEEELRHLEEHMNAPIYEPTQELTALRSDDELSIVAGEPFTINGVRESGAGSSAVWEYEVETADGRRRPVFESRLAAIMEPKS